MSFQQVSHSPDIRRLLDEGFAVGMVSGYLTVSHIPYVNSVGAVREGTLVSELTLAGDVTTRPSTHVVYFVGEKPYTRQGEPLQIINNGDKTHLADELDVDFTFSSKPASGYADYYEKIHAYSWMLASHAQAIDSSATPLRFAVCQTEEHTSVFNYLDTASSRAQIDTFTAKFRKLQVAIVGLGGTGSYILDLVAKTPVQGIHIFDGDDFLQHNAFRSPGAPSIEHLRRRMKKVDYYHEQYSAFRCNVIPHPYYIGPDTVEELLHFDYVFLSAEGTVKQTIAEALIRNGIPFIDVGMGLQKSSAGITGIIRVTTATDRGSSHVGHRVCFETDDIPNDYAPNIQLADLNALNASLAVIKWKKLIGFYADFEHEHHSTYTIDGNTLLNEEHL